MKYKLVLFFMSIITYFCSQTSIIAQTDNDLFDELSTTAQNRIIQACINYHKTKDSWNLESAIQYIFKREKGELFGPLLGLLYQIQIESFTSINQCQKSSFRQQKVKPSETRVSSNKESMLLQANNLNRQGKYQDAINIYSKLIENSSKQPQINKQDIIAYYTYRADAYYHASEYEKAIRDFTTLISLDADNPQFYENRSYLWRLLGNTQKEIEDLTKLISLKPNVAEYYKLRAIAYFSVEKFDFIKSRKKRILSTVN